MPDNSKFPGSPYNDEELEALLNVAREQQAAQRQRQAAQRPQQAVQRPQQAAQRPQQAAQRPQQAAQRPQQAAQRPQQAAQRPRQSMQNSQHPAQRPPLRDNRRQAQPNIVTTNKNGIRMYEDKTDYSKVNDKNASYYSGEVYFASKKPTHTPTYEQQQRTHAPQGKTPVRKAVGAGSGVKSLKGFNLSDFINNFLNNGGRKAAIIYIAVLVLISILLSIHVISLVNDILAFNRGDDVKTITVADTDSTNDIISQLDKAGLIKHSTFCKIFMLATKSLHEVRGEPVYLSGVYYLTPSMGLEKMLLSCQEIQKSETVNVTIPEGFTLEQIAQKLEKAGVCMKDEFYNNLSQAEFNYKILNTIENKSSRYEYLEGYLYPDTYEFYVGQNGSSVINVFLENATAKWTDEYRARAEEMGMTVDEVITLASIVQKEAADAEQMPTVAAIFLNRLNSSGFPSLQSDATNVYVNKYIKPNVSTGEFDNFYSRYSTYECIGLPAGPICCPGDDAIRAVLYPGSTDAYYFCHDAKGRIYTAKTEAEHQANYVKALNGG